MKLGSELRRLDRFHIEASERIILKAIDDILVSESAKRASAAERDGLHRIAEALETRRHSGESDIAL